VPPERALVLGLAEMPSWNRLFVTGANALIEVWDTERRERVFDMSTIGHGIHAVAVSPDEQWLAVGDNRDHISL
jgi:WD40 repeat protein